MNPLRLTVPQVGRIFPENPSAGFRKAVCRAWVGERGYARRRSRQLFVYYRNGDLLGIGLIGMSKMFDKLASIGMFTNDIYRKQGFGKAIIIQLRNWCNQNGITPISGCWYYNETSKRMLESGGMVTRTRLINIEVTNPRRR
ncbi:MAG: GNAT family N-acetyltransferase [Candidatus Pristimantibacillus sp.]